MIEAIVLAGSSPDSQEVDLQVRIREPGGIFQLAGDLIVFQEIALLPLSVPFAVPSGSDIEVVATANAGTAKVQAGFGMSLTLVSPAPNGPPGSDQAALAAAVT